MLKPFQKTTQVWNHWSLADFAVFSSCFSVAANNDFSAIKAAVCPAHVRSLALYTQAGIGEELDQVCAGQPRQEWNAAKSVGPN